MCSVWKPRVAGRGLELGCQCWFVESGSPVGSNSLCSQGYLEVLISLFCLSSAGIIGMSNHNYTVLGMESKSLCTLFIYLLSYIPTLGCLPFKAASVCTYYQGPQTEPSR